MAHPLRVCSWNIKLGTRLERILDALEGHDDFRELDLLALQEASIHHEREDARSIAEALGASYDSYQVMAHVLRRRVQANALVWNTTSVRMESKDRVDLPRHQDAKLSRGERVLLRALPVQQRISLVMDARFGETLLRVYVAHLDVVGFQHKREQFARILADAQMRRPSDLTLLAADLNTFGIRSLPSWRQLHAAAAVAGWRDLTKDIEWTFALRSVRFRQKLDAIFAGSAHPLRARVWTLNIRASDHLPVFAEITME